MRSEEAAPEGSFEFSLSYAELQRKRSYLLHVQGRITLKTQCHSSQNIFTKGQRILQDKEVRIDDGEK